MTPEASLAATVAELREVVRDLRSAVETLRAPSPHAPVVTKPYLTIAEVAAELGVSERTFRRLRVRRGFPKPMRGPGPLRWSRSAIDAHLERTR